MTKAEFIFTEKTAHDMTAEYFRLTHSRKGTVLRIFCGLVLTAVSSIALWRLRAVQDIQSVKILLPLFLLQLCAGLILLLYKPLTLFQQRRAFAKSPDLGALAIYAFADDGISGNRFGTEQTIPWSIFRKVSVTDAGIMLVLPDGACHWIPRSALHSPEEWSVVSAIVIDRCPVASHDE